MREENQITTQKTVYFLLILEIGLGGGEMGDYTQQNLSEYPHATKTHYTAPTFSDVTKYY